jgi:predicted O-methyltransferase YrrM
MKYTEVVENIKGLRWMSTDQGKILYDLVNDNDIQNVLELGFFHGVSAMYMAAALQEKGGNGLITTIDKFNAKELQPNIEDLSSKLGLSTFIKAIYAHNCYTWELLRLLELKPRPSFDLIFIDGAHLWKTDGFAFFLCDKLLAENGYLIMDDISWSMAKNADPTSNEWTKKYSDEEQATNQLEKVFDLLVKEHPSYDDFRIEDGWAYARKIGSNSPNSVKESIKVKTVLVTHEMLKARLNGK